MPLLTEHDAIREWTIARGGRPSITEMPKPTGGSDQVLRLVFGQPGATPAMTSDATSLSGPAEWPDWFKVFDDSKLALQVPEEVAGSLDSTHSLVAREG